MVWNLSLAALLLVAGAAITVTGVLGLRGRLPRNRLVGIRIPSVLASDDAWRRGHRAAGLPLAAGGGAMILAALCVPFLPGDDAVAAVVLTGAVVTGAAAVAAAVLAHRATTRR